MANPYIFVRKHSMSLLFMLLPMEQEPENGLERPNF
jgi:hypothetical protein